MLGARGWEGPGHRAGGMRNPTVACLLRILLAAGSSPMPCPPADCPPSRGNSPDHTSALLLLHAPHRAWRHCRGCHMSASQTAVVGQGPPGPGAGSPWLAVLWSPQGGWAGLSMRGGWPPLLPDPNPGFFQRHAQDAPVPRRELARTKEALS